MSTIPYPPTRKSDIVEDYHGTPVADPYRWLEDTDSEETRQWIEEQNALTFSFLEKIPERNQIPTQADGFVPLGIQIPDFPVRFQSLLVLQIPRDKRQVPC